MSFVSPIGAYPQYDSPFADRTSTVQADNPEASLQISSSQTTATAAPTQSSYQTEYNNLVTEDAQELATESIASPSASAANLNTVLAQAAQYQANGYQPIDTTA